MLACAQITIRDDADIITSSVSPTSPSVNALWLDTSVSPNVLKRWNGSAWVIVNDTSALVTRVESAEQRITPSAIISVVTASEEMALINERLSEAESSITQNADAITFRASQTDFDELADRMDAAELMLTPESIAATVRSTGIYEYDAFEGRNYAIGGRAEHTFVDGYVLDENGVATTSRYVEIPLSPQLFANSGNASRLYISLDVLRTDIAQSNTDNAYCAVWIRYRYPGSDGTMLSNERGWYIRTTESNFSATDSDWVRIKRDFLNLTTFNATELTHVVVGIPNVKAVTGTLKVRNITVEAQTQVGEWSPAPEESDSVPLRLAQAESGIRLNANQLTLKVSQTDLEDRLAEASLNISPEQIVSAVRSVGIYHYEHYEGRNYLLDSEKEYVFTDGFFLDDEGNPTTNRFIYLYYSDDLVENSGYKNLRLSFDIKYENVMPTNSRYFSMWLYYNYINNSGNTSVTGRGWALTTTTALNRDWFRWRGGPLDLTSFNPTGLAYLSIGLANGYPMTGTVRIRNIKVEVGNAFTDWSVAPDDPDAVAIRLAKAESRITQNASSISVKVSQGNIISAINQTAETISIAASKLDLNGVITANGYFRINADGSMTCTNGTYSGALSAATGTFAGALSAATGTFAGSLIAGGWTFSSSGSSYVSGNYSVNMNVAGLYANFYTSNLNARYGSTSYNDTVIYGGCVKLDCASTGQSVSVRNGYWGAYSYQDVCLVCDQGGNSYATASGNLGTTDNRWDICWVDTIHYNSRANDSSRELKHDIEALPSMGGVIDKLQPVSFKYNDDKHDWKRFGLIYEDTVDVLPEICHETTEGDSVSKGISYEDIIAVLIKEVQELRARVSVLEAAR